MNNDDTGHNPIVALTEDLNPKKKWKQRLCTHDKKKICI